MVKHMIFLLINNTQPRAHTTCDRKDRVQNLQKHNVRIKVSVIRNSSSSYLIRPFYIRQIARKESKFPDKTNRRNSQLQGSYLNNK